MIRNKIQNKKGAAEVFSLVLPIFIFVLLALLFIFLFALVNKVTNPFTSNNNVDVSYNTSQDILGMMLSSKINHKSSAAASLPQNNARLSLYEILYYKQEDDYTNEIKSLLDYIGPSYPAVYINKKYFLTIYPNKDCKIFGSIKEIIPIDQNLNRVQIKFVIDRITINQRCIELNVGKIS
ncbi:hypothetical protein H6503_01790 [Candidatus Woesearchaeota archaeon]|nr:hypothetical protein [Candidatus Woesearchaeota archaeon]